MKTKLKYNVYIRDGNEIKLYNVLNHIYVRRQLLELLKEYKKCLKCFNQKIDYLYKPEKYIIIYNSKSTLENFKKLFKKDVFEKRLKLTLQCEFWSRFEYETVLTDWPPHITKSELERLNSENFSYAFHVNLETERKIDVFEQITNNWDIFVNYVWNNLENADLKIKE